MKLYYSPLACSLASRIALYEAGAEATFIEVDPMTKTTSDGADFRTINPLGLVPAIVMDDGTILTENAAILQHIAESFPDAVLAPRDSIGRARLQQWLSFVGTELHTALYVPLLTPSAPQGAKEFALSKAASRLSWVAAMLEGHDFACGAFSVADAYLFAVLNWSTVTPVDLKPWATITSYQARIRARPCVARAFTEERALFAEEQARHAKANAHLRPALPLNDVGSANMDDRELARFIERYVAMWHEPDPVRRRETVAELFAEDAENYTRRSVYRGIEAITLRVAHAHEEWVRSRGQIFEPTTNTEAHHHLVKFFWQMRPTDGGPALSVGLDVFVLDGTSKIRALYQFIEPTPG